MKMLYCLLMTAVLLPIHNASAQKCEQEELRKKPGTWKVGMAGSVRGVAAADVTKSKAVMANVHKMISSAYSPVGCQAQYSNSFSASEHFLSNPYHYSIYILRYLCESNPTAKTNWYVDYSTPTTVTVAANVIYSLNNLNAGDLRDDMRGYLKLTKRPVKKEGYFFMGEEIVNSNDPQHPVVEYRWLITYDDKLPFRFLNRKEYLAMLKNKLLKQIKESPGEQEYLGAYVKNIDEYLKQPESELTKDAICMWNQEERFESFVDEGTKGSFIAVVPDLTYYRKSVPKGAPQFFSVVYKISKNDPVFEDNIARIQKAVDPAALRNMLGK